MQYYALLKQIHIFLALASGIGFALRGFTRIVMQRPLDHRFWKIMPHVVDTLLLASGITLWMTTGWSFLSWLGVKLVLVITYILLGIAAFRARRQTSATSLYLAALLVFLSVAGLALHKPL